MLVGLQFLVLWLALRLGFWVTFIPYSGAVLGGALAIGLRASFNSGGIGSLSGWSRVSFVLGK